MNEVIIIAGPSWSWKDTLVSNLLKTWKYQKLISDTTREKRNWEIEGRDYYFVTKDLFWKNFKEWVYFQYNDFVWNLYAYKKEELLKKIKETSLLVICHPQVIMLITFFLKQFDIPYKTVYLDISKKKTFERMIFRGDSDQNIKNRKTEYWEFIWYKSKADFVLDAEKSQTTIVQDFYYNLFVVNIKEWSIVEKIKDKTQYTIKKITKKSIHLCSKNNNMTKVEKDDWEETWFFEYLLWKYRVLKNSI